MKTGVWYGGRDIRIEDVAKPKVRNREVLVRVRSVGICGSDLHAYEGVSERRKPPLVMGHEFSGEVTEVGRSVKQLRAGERVVADPMTRCGACQQCLHGQENVCRDIRLLGLHTSGAFAEYVSVPAGNCYKLPDDVSFEEATLIEPLAVAVHAISRASIRLGDTVVVIGAGVIGLMLLQVARAAGAGRVFVTDVLDYRLGFAERLGADATINSKAGDPLSKISELTQGSGADIVLEAVGREVTVQQAMRMARIGGRLTVVGMLQRTMGLDILDAVVRELDIKGSYGYTSDDFQRAFNLIKDSRVDVKPLVTNVFPLDELQKGFEVLHEKKEGVLKILLKP